MNDWSQSDTTEGEWLSFYSVYLTGKQQSEFFLCVADSGSTSLHAVQTGY